MYGRDSSTLTFACCSTFNAAKTVLYAFLSFVNDAKLRKRCLVWVKGRKDHVCFCSIIQIQLQNEVYPNQGQNPLLENTNKVYRMSLRIVHIFQLQIPDVKGTIFSFNIFSNSGRLKNTGCFESMKNPLMISNPLNTWEQLSILNIYACQP